jgi:tetratricopeptide (TPR) repeat protein
VRTVNNLAVLYHDQRRFDKAEPLFNRALAAWEKTLGPEHPEVALSLYNLAELHRVQHHYAQAEPLYKRALAIQEKSLGANHPKVAAGLQQYALLLRSTKRGGEARAMNVRAQAILAGNDRPRVPAGGPNVYSKALREEK